MALGVLGSAIFLWGRQNMNSGAAAAAESGEERVVEKRVVSEFESPTEDEALNLVKRALETREAAGVAEYFHPGSASPERVVGFLNGMEEADGPVERMNWLGSMDANGILLDGVLVKTRKGDRLKNRLAFLTPDERGAWKVDFDAFARTVEPSWNELLENKAAEGLVRVIAAADSYYNGPFGDDSQWVCYGMASPDTEEVLLGYCRRGSPQARAMARIVLNDDALPNGLSNGLSGARSLKRVIVKIRRAEGGEARQFEISRVMAEDWVMSGEPFDGKFQ